MQQRIIPQHEVDGQGRPAGGQTLIVISEDDLLAPSVIHALTWQNGPLKDESGRALPPNGLFVESLIAAAADRIRLYQRSPFACRENADASAHLLLALEALRSRTARRTAAGIEGTHGVQSSAEGAPAALLAAAPVPAEAPAS